MSTKCLKEEDYEKNKLSFNLKLFNNYKERWWSKKSWR